MSSITITEEPTGPDAPVDNSIPPKPEYVPDKFYDAKTGEVRYEDLAKSYAELEKKLGQPRKPEEPPTTEATDEQPSDEEVANILTANGLNPQAFTVELEQNGKLSEESYTQLASKGFSREMVDTYIAGLQSSHIANEAGEVLAQRDLEEVYGSVGGKETFTAIAQWAAINVSQQELDTYNEMVNSGNKTQAIAAVHWIKSMYENANGREPSLLHGDGSKAGTVEPFRSNAQVVEAMSNPRYKSDPAYRDEVAKRLAASKIF